MGQPCALSSSGGNAVRSASHWHGGVSHATLRRHALTVGARLTHRVAEPEEYDWPESTRELVPAANSLSVAIDGTYIRADGKMLLREYHVIAGRIEREGKL